jgi:hypothetical protein
MLHAPPSHLVAFLCTIKSCPSHLRDAAEDVEGTKVEAPLVGRRHLCCDGPGHHLEDGVGKRKHRDVRRC